MTPVAFGVVGDLAFTVVIPAHDDFPLLEKCLAGWASQRDAGADLSVIVVDNDSAEDIRSSLSVPGTLDIELVRRPGLPHPFALASARNLAIERASTPYIVTCDADCIPNPFHLRAAAAAIESHDGGLMATGERIFVDGSDLRAADLARGSLLGERPRPIASTSNYGRVRDLRYPDAVNLPDGPHPWTYMHGCNTVFPRQAALDIGGFDTTYDANWGHEDIDFAYRMITGAGCRPLWVPGMEVYHQEPQADPAREAQRTDRTHNPNWIRLCERIPGYDAFKRDQYRRLGIL